MTTSRKRRTKTDLSAPEYTWCILCRKGDHDGCDELAGNAIWLACVCSNEGHEETF